MNWERILGFYLGFGVHRYLTTIQFCRVISKQPEWHLQTASIITAVFWPMLLISSLFAGARDKIRRNTKT